MKTSSIGQVSPHFSAFTVESASTSSTEYKLVEIYSTDPAEQALIKQIPGCNLNNPHLLLWFKPKNKGQAAKIQYNFFSGMIHRITGQINPGYKELELFEQILKLCPNNSVRTQISDALSERKKVLLEKINGIAAPLKDLKTTYDRLKLGELIETAIQNPKNIEILDALRGKMRELTQVMKYADYVQ